MEKGFDAEQGVYMYCTMAASYNQCEDMAGNHVQQLQSVLKMVLMVAGRKCQGSAHSGTKHLCGILIQLNRQGSTQQGRQARTGKSRAGQGRAGQDRAKLDRAVRAWGQGRPVGAAGPGAHVHVGHVLNGGVVVIVEGDW